MIGSVIKMQNMKLKNIVEINGSSLCGKKNPGKKNKEQRRETYEEQ